MVCGESSEPTFASASRVSRSRSRVSTNGPRSGGRVTRMFSATLRCSNSDSSCATAAMPAAFAAAGTRPRWTTPP